MFDVKPFTSLDKQQALVIQATPFQEALMYSQVAEIG